MPVSANQGKTALLANEPEIMKNPHISQNIYIMVTKRVCPVDRNLRRG